MKIIKLWNDPDLTGLYKKATIEWSRPKIWRPDNDFDVPSDYRGYGGIYMLIRNHRKQKISNIITYIGKTGNFENRLTTQHHKYDALIKKAGDTKVSCGYITYQNIKEKDGYINEIETIMIFCIWNYLENKHGFGNLPGFGSKPISPWIIDNIGFKGKLPRRIFYPAFAMQS